MQKHVPVAEFDTYASSGSATDFLTVLQSRRSTAPKRLVPPGPTRKEVARIVQAGLTAPDHGMLRPWKFLFVSRKKRELLGELFATEKRQYMPDASAEDIEKERVRAFNAPALIAVLLNPYPDHPRATIVDQYLSLGAAIQNILLAAHSMGYGAMMTSGRKIGSALLQNAFSPTGAQQLVGFISIGTPSSAPKPRDLPCLNEHFRDWE